MVVIKFATKQQPNDKKQWTSRISFILSYFFPVRLVTFRPFRLCTIVTIVLSFSSQTCDLSQDNFRILSNQFCLSILFISTRAPDSLRVISCERYFRREKVKDSKFFKWNYELSLTVEVAWLPNQAIHDDQFWGISKLKMKFWVVKKSCFFLNSKLNWPLKWLWKCINRGYDAITTDSAQWTFQPLNIKE